MSSGNGLQLFPLMTEGGVGVHTQSTVGADLRHPLTQVQREIMRHIDVHGNIRSVEAGVMMHAARDRSKPEHSRCEGGTKRVFDIDSRTTRRIYIKRLSCCEWAATDGLEAMKRLMKRGIVIRHPLVKGLWVRS